MAVGRQETHLPRMEPRHWERRRKEEQRWAGRAERRRSSVRKRWVVDSWAGRASRLERQVAQILLPVASWG